MQAGSLEHLKILVVDDEPINIIAITHNLKMAVKDMNLDPNFLEGKLH